MKQGMEGESDQAPPRASQPSPSGTRTAARELSYCTAPKLWPSGSQTSATASSQGQRKKGRSRIGLAAEGIGEELLVGFVGGSSGDAGVFQRG